MSAREEILGRIRAALADVPASETPEEVTVRRDYRHSAGFGDAERLDVFAERVADYRATVHRVSAGELAAGLSQAVTTRNARRLLVPHDLPADLRPDGVELVEDDGSLPIAELDAVDGVLTGCAVGIAETGTIVLDAGAGQGRRAISLVPDYHLCVVRADQVVGSVPEAIGRLDGTRPTTFVSGPSATSDIELNRVEGVHGPRTLEVFLVSG